MKNKTCNKCQEEKPLEDFPKHRSMKDGHLNQCKVCTKLRKAEHYRRNRESIRAKQKARYDADGEPERARARDYRAKNLDTVNAKRRKRYQDNPEAEKEQQRKYRLTEKGRDALARSTRRAREKSPEKYAARNAVNNALQSGDLVKPDICSICGKLAEVEAHHHSYDTEHQLDVVWVCQSCHKAIHRAICEG